MKITSSNSTPGKAAGTSIRRKVRNFCAFTQPAADGCAWTGPTDPDLTGIGVYVRTATLDGNASAQSALCMAVVGKLEADGWVFQKTLSDVGASGRDDSRPGLRALLALANAGAIGAAVVSDISRLSRSVTSLMWILDFLRKRGVRVFSRDGAITDMRPFSGRMV